MILDLVMLVSRNFNFSRTLTIKKIKNRRKKIDYTNSDKAFKIDS